METENSTDKKRVLEQLIEGAKKERASGIAGAVRNFTFPMIYSAAACALGAIIAYSTDDRTLGIIASAGSGMLGGSFILYNLDGWKNKFEEGIDKFQYYQERLRELKKELSKLNKK